VHWVLAMWLPAISSRLKMAVATSICGLAIIMAIPGPQKVGAACLKSHMANGSLSALKNIRNRPKGNLNRI